MKNIEVIRRAPSYLKNFKCIGGACEDTCCAGWSIEVDEGTYKKYKKVKNSSLLSKFLNDKKSRIRCKSGNSLVQTLLHLLGSFYLIFYLKFPFVTYLFFTFELKL